MYYDWLMSKISCQGYNPDDYSMVLGQLYGMEFIWVVDRDVNRAMDGIDLRGFYEFETGESCEINADWPCSVLEMMVALALRMESDIMDDPDFGDRTPLWFWKMMENLGLTDMENNRFDGQKCEEIVTKMMLREGEKDLFCCATFVPKKWHTMEIWQKMTAFLNENFVF